MSSPERTWQEAVTCTRQAQLHIRRREFAEAERLLLRGMLLFRQTVGEDDLNYSVCLNNLGALYHVLGDDARAEPLLREVVEVRRRIAGEAHPMYLQSLQDLAEFHRSRNDAPQAAAWQRRAEEVEEKLRGGKAP